MIGLLHLVFAVLASTFKSKSRLEAALRHQLIVLRRKVRGGVPLSSPCGTINRGESGIFARRSCRLGIGYCTPEQSTTPVHFKEYELRDRMLRKACGSFVLMKAGDKPDDPEVEEPFSLEEVFYWLQECPEQISRTTVRGSAGRKLPLRKVRFLAQSGLRTPASRGRDLGPIHKFGRLPKDQVRGHVVGLADQRLYARHKHASSLTPEWCSAAHRDQF
jgi:hypothetical protein